MSELEKLAEELVNLNVVQLNELSRILKEKYGINIGEGLVVGGASASAQTEEKKAETKTQFDLVLVGISPTASKLKIIQAIKKILDVDLKKAKELTDNLPSTLKQAISKEDAEPIINELSELGCSLELR